MEDKVFELHAEIKVRLTKEDVDDIMDTALSGIAYWADEAKVEGEYLGEYSSEQIARGGKLHIHVEEPFDENDTEWYTLDREKFMDGVRQWLEGCDSYTLEHGRIDASEIDAIDADMIIQYALFGEQVFA